MSKDAGKFSTPAVGGSSLLVIFAVLCLTVFALLSLATVRADQRLSDASAKAIQDYYAADVAAEEQLAQLRGEALPTDLTPQRHQYAVPISDTQELQVEVELTGPSYRVLRWQAVPVGEWQPDDDIHVWGGD